MLLQQNGVFLHGADALRHDLHVQHNVQARFDFDRACKFDSLNNKPVNQFEIITPTFPKIDPTANIDPWNNKKFLF